MAKPSKIQDQLEAIVAEVAASAGSRGFPDLDQILDTFEEVSETPEYVLRPGQLPPVIDISCLGRGRSNITCTDLAKGLAADNGVSPQFEAVKTQYSKPTHSLLCTPVAKYTKSQQDLAEVTWSPDATEMRIDLGAILAAQNWRIAPGYELRCQVAFVRKHPKVGSAMVIFLSEEGLRESRYRIRKKNLGNNDEDTTTNGPKAQGRETESMAPESKGTGSNQTESSESKATTLGGTGTAVNGQITD